MGTGSDNEQRLRREGVVIRDDLPAEYTAVFEGLTPDEVDVIVAVKRRLDEAHRVSDIEIGQIMIAP